MPPEAADADLSTDAPGGEASSSTLQQLLARERAAHAETSKDLQVERAAHDETAEKMVQLQQRLEVTLQELANLERFTKRQQSVATPSGTPPHVERLLKEESYLKSRLLFVQQASDASHTVADSRPPASPPPLSPPRVFVPAQELAEARGTKPVAVAAAGAQDAEDRAIESALSI